MLRFTLIIFALATQLPSLAVAESRLYRSLVGRNEIVRLRALASVNPKQNPAALPDLIAAARVQADKAADEELVTTSTVALLFLIGQFDDPSAEALLIELLDARHTGIAMISADSLGTNQRTGAIQALKEQSKRPAFSENYGFRFNLVRALAQMKHPDAVEFLTELENTIDGQLHFHLMKVLDEVTIHDFRGDKQRFEKWQQRDEIASEDRVRFFTAGDRPESLDRIQFVAPQYYGIDIHAKRLMFIIDHSGSMKEYWGAYTRLDRAKYELVRAIEELPEDTEFAIAFYESTVRMWREELVRATAENKREAIQFVHRLGYGDKTNTYEALRRALEFDEALEAVFLLTDGRPTTGNLVVPGQIVPDIIHRNRFRHLNINTIGIAVEGATQQFLESLAEQSNGEYRTAEWAN